MNSVSTEVLSPAALAAELYVMDSDDQARVFNEFGRLHAETNPKRFADHLKWIASSKAINGDGWRVLRDLALEILPQLEGESK